MKSLDTSSLAGLAAVGVAILGAACRSPHRMRADAQATTTVCRTCYDKAVEVWDVWDRDSSFGRSRWSNPTPRVFVTHQCPECGTTAVVHTEDGRWMITCPRCAPEGLPCDRCQPPEAVESETR